MRISKANQQQNRHGNEDQKSVKLHTKLENYHFQYVFNRQKKKIERYDIWMSSSEQIVQCLSIEFAFVSDCRLAKFHVIWLK